MFVLRSSLNEPIGNQIGFHSRNKLESELLSKSEQDLIQLMSDTEEAKMTGERKKVVSPSDRLLAPLV